VFLLLRLLPLWETLPPYNPVEERKENTISCILSVKAAEILITIKGYPI